MFIVVVLMNILVVRKSKPECDSLIFGIFKCNKHKVV